MTRRVGIELSPSRCALVDLDLSPGGPPRAPAHVRSFRTIPWSPENAEAFVATLRLLRKSKIVPARAVVALWDVEGDALQPAPAARVRARLAPLVAAQFAIESVITPAMALASLSRLLAGAETGEPRAYVAVNTDATAVAIARDGLLLYGREITVPFRTRPCPPDAAERMRSADALDFVRRLAPELKRSLLAFRQQSNAGVRQIVVCGHFPGLRMLTAPLMTSLQVEVEILDSMHGLVPAGAAPDAGVLEQAGALRVAWATALTASRSVSLLPLSATGNTSRVRAAHVAAAACVIVALAAWFGAGRWTRGGPDPAPPRPQAARADVTLPDGERDHQAAAPAPQAGQLPAPSPDTGRRFARPRRQPRPAAIVEERAADPVVQSILFAADRRLALIDHRIVRVGDRVEAGVVVDIEPKAVTVRRPSGQLLRVEMKKGSD